MALFFANVSEQPVAATWRFDANVYGLSARQLNAEVTEGGRKEPRARELIESGLSVDPAEKPSAAVFITRSR